MPHTPEQRRVLLEREISSLQKDLDLLNLKIKSKNSALGLIGEKLRKLVWAPEVLNLTPQIFSWTSEGDPLVQEIAESLFLQERGDPVRINLKEGPVDLSLFMGRLWLTAEQACTLWGAIECWQLQVEDLSHPFEKIENLREKIHYLDLFLLSLFPLREIPKP
jgi:hypothetical protein